MSEPQCYQTPGEELVVKKCWSPPCDNVAAFRDGAGWYWCFEHQERAMWGVDKKVTYTEIVANVRKLLKGEQNG